MKYTIGEKYTINPHGTNSQWNIRSQKWEPYNGSVAEYVGEIEIDKLKIPVFKFDFYSYGDPTCYLALYKNRWMCGEKSIEELIESIKAKVFYRGRGYSKIKTEGGPLEIEEFKSQARSAGIEEAKVDDFIMKGSFYSTYSNKGQIKHCPHCKVIRQTSCSACGCGSCEVCNYRWVCCPISFENFNYAELFLSPAKIENTEWSQSLPTNLL